MLSFPSFVASRGVQEAVAEQAGAARERDDALNVMRGLVNGLILSAAFWALILWLLL